MDSNKNKERKILILEERHTKSLAVSKELRSKIEQSLFIPREFFYTPDQSKKAHSKMKRSLAQEAYSKKLTCAKSCETIRINNKEFSQATSESSTVATQNAEKCLATKNQKTHSNTIMRLQSESLLNVLRGFRSNTKSADLSHTIINEISDDEENIETPSSLQLIAENNANETKNNDLLENVVEETTDCLQIDLTNNETIDDLPIATRSADLSHTIIINEISDEEENIETPSSLQLITENNANQLKNNNLLENVVEETADCLQINLTNNEKIDDPPIATRSADLSHTIIINEISDEEENIETPNSLQLITENNANQLKNNNFLENVVEETADCLQINLTNNEKIDDQPTATRSAEAEKVHSTGKQNHYNHNAVNLFQTDFQNFVHDVLSTATTENCSLIDLEIGNDLWNIDKCAKSFSEYISHIYKDLDDKEMATQNCIEYARQKDTEREKLLQPDGPLLFNFNQTKTTQEIPGTFTIYIEADNLPKKAITFETSDILNLRINANNYAFHDGSGNMTRQPEDQRNPTVDPQAIIEAYASNDEKIKNPVLPSSGSTKTRRNIKKKTAPLKSTLKPRKPRKSKRNSEQVSSVEMTGSNPYNVENQTLSTSATNHLSSHINHGIQNQTDECNNLHAPPHYCNYLPEMTFACNSWLAAEEQWRERVFYPQVQNLNSESTVEVPNENCQYYQYHPVFSMPILQNPYLHPIIERNVCHNPVTNYLPT